MNYSYADEIRELKAHVLALTEARDKLQQENDQLTAFIKTGHAGLIVDNERLLVAKVNHLQQQRDEANTIAGNGLDEIRRLVERVQALDAAASWQPIATAPKDDGQDLILVDADGLVGHGFFDRSIQIWRWIDNAPLNNPTHWQLMPAPPAAARREEPT